MSKEKIAVYGLGTETQSELPGLLGQYEVVGLLDSFRTEGEIYGLRVIPVEEAVRLGIRRIIVVARPGSCKAIAKRIGELCRRNEIKLYDIRGKDLLQSPRVVYDFKTIKGYKRTEVIEAIKHAEAVSFDLFDTLIIRNVMYPSDVIDIVAARLKERGIEPGDFSRRRMAAEKELSSGRAPRLTEIYEKVLEDCREITLSASGLARLEYETELSLIEAREAAVNLIQAAKGAGKSVYITTDTYYSGEEIKGILEKTGIRGVDGILVSCEYGTGKTGELFKRLLDAAGMDRILHIGDDIVSDIKSAEKHGIRTFQLYSGAELLDGVGGLGLMDHAESLSDRIRIGMFTADIFNSPFQFEREDRRICADTAEDIGYLFCAPVLHDFSRWFGEEVQREGLKNIWFCARDGYLLQKLFKKLYPDVRTEYFLTSRTAAIRAGVEDEEDIRYVESMKFSGIAEENLWRRFGIRAEEWGTADIDGEKTGLLRYTQAILKSAEVKRANNRKYIDSLSVADGKIAFFDFVAKGTSQMYVQRMAPDEVVGLYFLQLEPEFMRDRGLCIKPFYTKEEQEKSAVFDNYYILETLLTSPEPSVVEFSEEGQALYAPETRSPKAIECIMKAQKGILRYTEKFLRICPAEEMKINKGLDEVLLALIHNVEISDQDFLSLKVEDPFFNRMTDITDVL